MDTAIHFELIVTELRQGNLVARRAATQAVRDVIAYSGIAVVHEPANLCGPGYYARWRREDGSVGVVVSGPGCDTESAAWLSAAFHLARYKPGVVEMTSREFASSWSTQSRFEIRRMADGQFSVFRLDRSSGANSCEGVDVRQTRHSESFPTIGAAADLVDAHIIASELSDDVRRCTAISPERLAQLQTKGLRGEVNDDPPDTASPSARMYRYGPR